MPVTCKELIRVDISTLNPTLIYLQMEKAFIPRTERQLLSPLDLILKGES